MNVNFIINKPNAMSNEDTFKTYALDNFIQNVKQRSGVHNIKSLKTGYSSSVIRTILGASAFIVDWQMFETEYKANGVSPHIH